MEKIKAIQAELHHLEELFKNSSIKSLEYGNRRATLLAQGLVVVAEAMGVFLKTPLHIDSRGEYHLVALKSSQARPDDYTGFGEAFSSLLNKHNPRCGLAPSATILPENGWCYLNHFEAEKMIKSLN